MACMQARVQVSERYRRGQRADETTLHLVVLEHIDLGLLDEEAVLLHEIKLLGILEARLNLVEPLDVLDGSRTLVDEIDDSSDLGES